MVEHVQWASIKLLLSITKYITLRRFSVLLDKLKLSRYVFWQKDILTCAKYFFCFNFAGSLMIDPMLDWCSGRSILLFAMTIYMIPDTCQVFIQAWKNGICS